MLVANSFDLWQKDTFFSAAEEVQQSADIMESAYRTWLRARREGLMPQDLDELARELQMALGTAKWQLEEFEKAVRLSYRNNGDNITIIRHRQFLSAIEDQISRVEMALKEAYVEGKKPFRWVNLDEGECDDLALFLSGTPETSQRIKDEGIKLGTEGSSSRDKNNPKKEDCGFTAEVSSKEQTTNEGRRSEEVVEEINSFIELKESKFRETGDEISYEPDQTTGTRRALEVVINSEDGQNNALTEATPKEKGFKPFFRRLRGGSYTQMRLISWINQHFIGGTRSQRQQQVSPVLPLNSIRFILALMLTIFLVVPFLVYSNESIPKPIIASSKEAVGLRW